MFHEERFPTNISFGALGGPERRTEIVTLANGHEERNTAWAHGRRRYDAGLGLRSLDDVAALIAFFEARQGQLIGFRWKDWSDYRSALPSRAVSPEDEHIGVGDGVQRVFQLVKTYRSGSARYVRLVQKPVAGTVLVSRDGAALVEGVDFVVSAETGAVTFTTAPVEGVELRAGFEFDVPVRFDTDRIQVSLSGFESGEVPQVPVVEIRL